MCPPPSPSLRFTTISLSPPLLPFILLVACSSLFSGVPVPQATPISEAEWLNLLDSPGRDPEAASDLAQGLDDVTLDDYSTTPSGAPSRLPDLLTAVDTAFSNLPSLEASFRPSSSTSTGQKSPRKRVPSWKTLRQLCDTATSRPAVVERMRERVEAILQRPGPTLLDSDGTWLIVLFEVRPTAKHDKEKQMCLTTVDFV